MKKEIKINKLCGWGQLIENVLKSIAYFNKGGLIQTLSGIENYVFNYNLNPPIGYFDYTTKRDGDTLEIYIDDELALSITMCTVTELVNNENY